MVKQHPSISADQEVEVPVVQLHELLGLQPAEEGELAGVARHDPELVAREVRDAVLGLVVFELDDGTPGTARGHPCCGSPRGSRCRTRRSPCSGGSWWGD